MKSTIVWERGRSCFKAKQKGKQFKKKDLVMGWEVTCRIVENKPNRHIKKKMTFRTIK